MVAAMERVAALRALSVNLALQRVTASAGAPSIAQLRSVAVAVSASDKPRRSAVSRPVVATALSMMRGSGVLVRVVVGGARINGMARCVAVQ